MSEQRTIYFVYWDGMEAVVVAHEATVSAKLAKIKTADSSTGYRRQFPVGEVHFSPHAALSNFISVNERVHKRAMESASYAASKVAAAHKALRSAKQ